MFYIYFLKKDEKVVYVGRTKDIKRRLSEHKEKDFNNYSFIQCNKDESSQLEDYYIMKYDPIYNNSLNSKGKYVSIEYFCEVNDFDVNEIRNICSKIPYVNPYFNENYNPYELNALKAMYEVIT